MQHQCRCLDNRPYTRGPPAQNRRGDSNRLRGRLQTALTDYLTDGLEKQVARLGYPSTYHKYTRIEQVYQARNGDRTFLYIL